VSVLHKHYLEWRFCRRLCAAAFLIALALMVGRSFAGWTFSNFLLVFALFSWGLAGLATVQEYRAYVSARREEGVSESAVKTEWRRMFPID
jgi:hypothetical protein